MRLSPRKTMRGAADEGAGAEDAEAAGDPGAIEAYRRFLRTAEDHFPALLGPVRERIAQLEKGR
mgnify:CR=1 FL=1